MSSSTASRHTSSEVPIQFASTPSGSHEIEMTRNKRRSRLTEVALNTWNEGEGMAGNRRRWGIVATILSLILCPSGLLAEQADHKSSAPAEATLFDYTRSPAFPD